MIRNVEKNCKVFFLDDGGIGDESGESAGKDEPDKPTV
jgi:hypothetical protein